MKKFEVTFVNPAFGPHQVDQQETLIITAGDKGEAEESLRENVPDAQLISINTVPEPMTGAKLRQGLLLAWTTRAEALGFKKGSKKREDGFMEFLSGVRIGILAQTGGLLDPDARTEIDNLLGFAQVRGEAILSIG